MLSDEQWLELYTTSVENRKDIVYIKDALINNERNIEDCQLRVNKLEVNQGIQKGKVAFLAVSITALLTIVTNAALWAFSHVGSAK